VRRSRHGHSNGEGPVVGARRTSRRVAGRGPVAERTRGSSLRPYLSWTQDPPKDTARESSRPAPPDVRHGQTARWSWRTIELALRRAWPPTLRAFRADRWNRPGRSRVPTGTGGSLILPHVGLLPAEIQHSRFIPKVASRSRLRAMLDLPDHFTLRRSRTDRGVLSKENPHPSLDGAGREWDVPPEVHVRS